MHDIEAGVPGLGPLAGSRGWQPIVGNPLPGGVSDAVGDVLRTMYGYPPRMGTNRRTLVRIGDTVFRDA
jgi:hypothetical protein